MLTISGPRPRDLARLARLGWTVCMAARDADAVRAAATTITDAQPDADVRVARLDVTDDTATLETTPADFLPVYGVNVLGPVRVTHAFLPLLMASAGPRLVMVSSGLGSIERVTDGNRIESQVPGMVYQSSKAALNMIATQYAKALPDVRVTTVDPGHTSTDLNSHSGPHNDGHAPVPV
ncbi:MAG: SDR family NAD(P)-dependent oxidoreductase [Nocardioidaceae bacterium]